MTELAWSDVIAGETFIGGDIESQEDGVVYRGRLSEIKEDDDKITFNSPWCARLNPETGEWENWHITTSFINKNEVVPYDIGDGRVHFTMPFLGVCTLFPKDGSSKLDTSKVKNLPKDSLRFLALYPELAFNRDVVAKVLKEKSWPRQAEALKALPANATLSDVTALFKYDSHAEEFLWHYVAELLGEAEPYKKIY